MNVYHCLGTRTIRVPRPSIDHRALAFAGMLVVCMALLTPQVCASASIEPEFDIPFEKFVLDNGLTLIVHEDHKAPIVAVNVWYHVGSKNEAPGKTGFAHLFEHLMFNGSEHYNDEYFKPFEQVGATDMNGTTSRDRTNYFQNVPSSALDVALWMESDRMGHMLGAVTQDKLDEQRGVVQNEKRQGENEPYGRVRQLIPKNTYPKGHPYSWTVIGSMEDLDAASLEDVHEWFKTYYGPNNAVVVVAGDIDVETALERTKHYFGSIPAGPPLAKHESWIAKRSGSHRQKLYDRVPLARLYKVWNIPQWGSRHANLLDLVSDVLAAGKTSRLYKRLVYEDQIATDVSAYVHLGEIAGQFVIEATAQPTATLPQVENAIDEELARLIEKGPRRKELERVKTLYEAATVRGAERIGGFGGKSDILARCEVFAGSPDYYKTNLRHVREATTGDLKRAAVEWLSEGGYILEIHPFPEFETADKDADRSRLPKAGEPPVAAFPELLRTSLSNGLSVILAERHTVPIVNFELLLDAGFAADGFAAPGTASLAMDMLDEGTKTRDSLEISEELALLGAHLGTGSNLDMSSISLSALKKNLDASLEIFADVILNASFPQKEFVRLQRQRVADIQQEKSSPRQIAYRVFPALLYGADHPYGTPFTGSGFEESVSKLTREDLVAFHQAWFKPNHATLIVVGDTRLDEIVPKLEKLFRKWKQGSVSEKDIRRVAPRPGSTVYIVERPGAVQSMIFAAHVAPPKANPDEIAIETMNAILGGSFSSRINMNLREDKHWSYGARSMFVDARGQRPFIAYASVQTDKTKEAMIEIKNEIEGIMNERPVTNDELMRAQNRLTLRLPGSWETISAVGGTIDRIIRFGLPDDYYEMYPEKVRALAVDDLTAVAGRVLHPNNIVWIIVGDRAEIEESIRAAAFGTIHHIDADGNSAD